MADNRRCHDASKAIQLIKGWSNPLAKMHDDLKTGQASGFLMHESYRTSIWNGVALLQSDSLTSLPRLRPFQIGYTSTSGAVASKNSPKARHIPGNYKPYASKRLI